MLVPVGELIADVPSPGSDQRKNKPPTLLEKNLIDIWIERAHISRHVRNVELDWPTAACFEIDEERPTLTSDEVAWMRFAVQQLLGSGAPTDYLTGAVQRVQEKMPVVLSERGGFVSVRDQPLSNCGSFHEVWCFNLDAPHPRMQAVERFCVFGW